MSEIMVRPSVEIEPIKEIEVDGVEVEHEGLGSAVDRHRDERGMVSAEWVMGIIAAVAVAGLLLTIVTNGTVEDGVTAVIKAILQGILGKV